MIGYVLGCVFVELMLWLLDDGVYDYWFEVLVIEVGDMDGLVCG